MSTHDRLRGLDVQIEGYSLEPQQMPGGWRRTTVVALHGGGHVGRGEDVAYAAGDQQRMQSRGPHLPLAGRWTLETLAAHLDGLTLWPDPPTHEMYRDYRRWAFESAALDLALAQAGARLDAILDRPLQPLRFVVSMGLGDPPASDAVHAWRAVDATLRFKLDATDGWSDALAAELAATGAVEVIDLKGAYVGTPVDQPPEPALYARVLRHFETAWIEDPGRSDATDPLLEGAWERVTWDAPLHRLTDITALAPAPRAINVKPSRFGALSELCAVYDHCVAEGIAMYAGGQFELSVGRRQAQELAALFHPDAGNDLAPAIYNTSRAGTPGLPRSPLSVAPVFGTGGHA